MLNKLKQAIQAELGPTNESGADLVTIGDNGNVVINESLVFEYGSYAIKKEARPVLDTLARALGNVLADPDVRANIDTILIQGHTDERGSASFNWDLSARRATAVLDYLFQANPHARRLVRRLLLRERVLQVPADRPGEDGGRVPAEPADRDRGHPQGRERPQGHRRLRT